MRDTLRRKAKEKTEAKRKKASTELFNFDSSWDDDSILAVTPPPVPLCDTPEFSYHPSKYDSHPYFIAIDVINTAINLAQVSEEIYAPPVKIVAAIEKGKLIKAKSEALYEHDKNMLQELIDRIDRTLIQPSLLTRDHFWNFRVPTASFIQPTEKPNEETLKRARTDSTDNIDKLEIPATQNKELFSEEIEDIGPLPDEFPEEFFAVEPVFVFTTSFSKIMAKIEEPHAENLRRPESPSSGEETLSPTLQPAPKKATQIPVEYIRFEFSLRKTPQREKHWEEQKEEQKEESKYRK